MVPKKLKYPKKSCEIGRVVMYPPRTSKRENIWVILLYSKFWTPKMKWRKVGHGTRKIMRYSKKTCKLVRFDVPTTYVKYGEHLGNSNGTQNFGPLK